MLGCTSLLELEKKCLLAHYFPEHTLEAKFVAYDCWIFFFVFYFSVCFTFSVANLLVMISKNLKYQESFSLTSVK